MLKRKLAYIAISTLAFFGFAITAYAAPITSYQPTLLPYSDQAFDLGTSTDQWRNLYVKGLTVTGTCIGCGSAFPFTPTTNFGALTNATNTPIWFQSGLQASSTSYFPKGTWTSTGNLVLATTTILSSTVPLQIGGAVGGNAWAKFCRDDASFFCTFLSSNNGAFNFQNTGSSFFAWMNGGTYSGSTGSFTSGSQDLMVRAGVVVVGTSTNNTLTGGHLGIWGLRGASNYFSITNADAGSSTFGDIFQVTSGGRVGIGTSSPWGALSVSNTSTSLPSFVVSTSSNVVAFQIDGNGNALMPQPWTKLIAGGGAVINASESQIQVLTASGDTATTSMSFGQVGSASWEIGSLQPSANNFNVWVNGAPAMTIARNGNLAANTKFYGTANTNTITSTGILSFRDAATQNSGLAMGYDSTNNWTWFNSGTIGNQNRPIAFFTNGLPSSLPAFYFGPGGNLSQARMGISSSSPYANLSIHLNNGDVGTTAFAIGSSTATATTTLFKISNTGTITTGIGSTASSTWVVNGKWQQDAYNTAGTQICSFFVGTTLTTVTGACNQ